MDDDKGCEGTVDGQRCQMRVTKLWCYIMQKLRKNVLVLTETEKNGPVL